MWACLMCFLKSVLEQNTLLQPSTSHLYCYTTENSYLESQLHSIRIGILPNSDNFVNHHHPFLFLKMPLNVCSFSLRKFTFPNLQWPNNYVLYPFLCRVSPCIQCFPILFQNFVDCLGGVMVSMLTSSVEGHGFDPWPGQTKDFKIGICCFSTKHTAFKE